MDKGTEKPTEKGCEFCGEPATNFHSRCCNVHFEGVIVDGRFGISCEKCGKFLAWLVPDKNG
jgi:hypothetical protein